MPDAFAVTIAIADVRAAIAGPAVPRARASIRLSIAEPKSTASSVTEPEAVTATHSGPDLMKLAAGSEPSPFR